MSTSWDRPGGKNQNIAGMVASLGAFSLGAAVGWSAPAEHQIVTMKAYGFVVTPQEYGLICSVLWLGCLVVAIPIGLLADRLGRKCVMLLVIPPHLVAWILILCATNSLMLIFSRFLVGICGGSYVITLPLYCAEIAEHDYKHMLASFYSIFFVLGILYAYIAGAFNCLEYLNYACAFLPVIYLASFIWMPESPVYYMLRNNRRKAEKSLKWLRERNVNMELAEISEVIEKQRDNQSPWWQTIRERSTSRAMVISTGLMFFKNFSGGTAIICYCTNIHREADYAFGFMPDLATVMVGICFVVFSIISMLSGNCSNRRRMLIFTIFLDVISNGLIAIYFLLERRQVSYFHNLLWLPFIAICCFVSFYGLGIGTLAYIIIMELFTVGFRTVGYAIVCSFFALFAFLNTLSYPAAVQFWSSENFFWMSMGMTFLAWIFVYFFVPDTRGLTPNQTQELLASTKYIVAIR